MLYRPNRELLSESLRDQLEITTFQQLYDILNEEFVWHYAEVPLKISFRYSGVDKRCGWDAWHVLLKHKQYEHPQAAGYINDNPENLIR